MTTLLPFWTTCASAWSPSAKQVLSYVLTILLHFHLWPLLLVLSLDTTEKRISLPSLLASIRYLRRRWRQPWAFPFLLTSPCCLTLSLYISLPGCLTLSLHPLFAQGAAVPWKYLCPFADLVPGCPCHPGSEELRAGVRNPGVFL